MYLRESFADCVVLYLVVDGVKREVQRSANPAIPIGPNAYDAEGPIAPAAADNPRLGVVDKAAEHAARCAERAARGLIPLSLGSLAVFDGRRFEAFKVDGAVYVAPLSYPVHRLFGRRLTTRRLCMLTEWPRVALRLPA
jgi:hypothetical protein